MLRVRALIFCMLFGDAGYLSAESLLDTDKSQLANRLVYFFGSSSLMLTDGELKEVYAEPNSASARIFRRILKERKVREENEVYVDKVKAPAQGRIISFEKGELRRAAMDELLSLGKEAHPVLVKTVHSSRTEIRLGVLKTIAHYKDEKFLRIFDSVLLRDRWGNTEFEMVCRKKAATQLWRYLEFDQGRELLMAAFTDLDSNVRDAVSVSSLQVKNKKDRKYVEKGLMKRYELELAKMNKAAFKKTEDQVMKHFLEKPSQILQFGKSISFMLQFDPKLMSQLDFPIYWSRHPFIGSILIKYSKILSAERRKWVLSHYIENPNQLTMTINSLKALETADKSAFSKMVGKLIENSGNSSVLLISMELAAKWQLKEYKAAIEKISQNDYRKTVREIAGRIVKIL